MAIDLALEVVFSSENSFYWAAVRLVFSVDLMLGAVEELLLASAVEDR